MAALEDGDEQGSADLAATWIAMHQQLQQLPAGEKTHHMRGEEHPRLAPAVVTQRGDNDGAAVQVPLSSWALGRRDQERASTGTVVTSCQGPLQHSCALSPWPPPSVWWPLLPCATPCGSSGRLSEALAQLRR